MSDRYKLPVKYRLTFDQFTNEAIKLFCTYREWFGLNNADEPEYKPEDKQIEFEDAFSRLICEHRGHQIGPNHWGNIDQPDQDICYRCERKKTDLIKERLQDAS